MKISKIHKSIVISVALGLVLSTFSSIGVFSSSAFAADDPTVPPTLVVAAAPATGETQPKSGASSVATKFTDNHTSINITTRGDSPGSSSTLIVDPPGSTSTCHTTKTHTCTTSSQPKYYQSNNTFVLPVCPTPKKSSGSLFAIFEKVISGSTKILINAAKNTGEAISNANKLLTTGKVNLNTTTTTTPTTTCAQPPFIAPMPEITYPIVFGTVYFYKTQSGSIAYTGSPPTPPIGSGFPSVPVDINKCLSSSNPIIYNMDVPLIPIGRNWSYSYTKTTTFTGPAGPGNTKDKYSNPVPSWGSCVLPTQNLYSCYTDLVSATFSGVSGIGASTTRITIPTGSGIFNGIAGSWSDVSNADPQLVNGIHTGPVISSWAFTPTKNGSYKTKFGSIYSTNNLSSLLSYLTNSKYCGGTLLDSIDVPKSLIDDGFYKLYSSGHYINCITNEVVNSNGVAPQVDHCGKSILGPLGKAILEKRCGQIPTFLDTDAIPLISQSDVFNDPSVCGGTPPPCVKDGSCPIVIIPTVGSPVEPVPTFTCSVTGNPIVLSPSNSTTSNGGLIQVISNAKTWALYWPVATFSDYGNIKDREKGIKNPQTSLVIWDGSKPFNWPGSSSSYSNSSINTDPGASTQPITGTPTLSIASDLSPAKIDGWGKIATSYLEFYKKGNATDKATFSQRQWFTAYFPHTKITMDASGNYINTTGYIELTKSCDAKVKQSFQVLGVNALPGQ